MLHRIDKIFALACGCIHSTEQQQDEALSSVSPKLQQKWAACVSPIKSQVRKLCSRQGIWGQMWAESAALLMQLFYKDRLCATIH